MQNMTGQEFSDFRKPGNDTVKKVVTTDLGRLRVRGPITPEKLREHRLSQGLCCFRPYNKQHEALIELCGQSDGLVFVAALSRQVVAYVSFQKPDFPWWIRRCFPRLLELGCIETDLSWRNMGLSSALLGSVFKNSDFTFFEDFIVIAAHTVYSWDLKNTCLTPWDYRRFMLHLFKKYDFVPWETEDPEIREHPCNILLARIGTNIEPEQIRHFSDCCLGIN